MSKLAGIDVATLNVFGWAKNQRDERTYDFGWLDEMMDKLHADGIGRLPCDKHGCTIDFQVVFFIGILYLLKVVEKRLGFCENSLFTVICYIMYDRSDDLDKWERQDRILEKPGLREEDGTIANHADVIVQGDQAYIFYFTHPGRGRIR